MPTYQAAQGLGKTKQSQYYLTRFDSYTDLLEAAAANPDKKKSDRAPQDNMNATQDFAEAYELAKHGWHEVRGQVDAALEPIRERLGQALGIVNERVFDMIGYEPDIDRFISGELECMVDDLFVEAPKEGKVFTLLVDASMAWYNKQEEIIERGAVLCGLVEAFAMMGYQLEVWVEKTVANERRTGFASVLVPISRAGDPLDIDQIMFAIGHPDFNRRIIWSYMETVPDYAQKFGYNERGYYGLTGCGAHMNEYVDASVIVSLDGNKAMTTDPVAWILGQLEMQGALQ